jgi:hypothetical protein
MSLMREASRANWNTDSPATLEQINAGSFQRIADAVEIMAKRYSDLIEERDRYLRNWRFQQGRAESLKRRNAALCGVITKMKKAQP